MVFATECISNCAYIGLLVALSTVFCMLSRNYTNALYFYLFEMIQTCTSPYSSKYSPPSV